MRLRTLNSLDSRPESAFGAISKESIAPPKLRT